MASRGLLGLLVLGSTAYGYVPRPRSEDISAINETTSLFKRADDPADFTWVKRWAAIGDSYTAGIGAGQPLGRVLEDELEITLPDLTVSGHGDWYCSRYDLSYPKVIDHEFGSHVEDFQFLACSGDRSEQIYQQAQQLKGDLDFVTMTAGGNDLCLAKIIQDCIMLPYFNTNACEMVIEKAEENVESILKGNVKQILQELDSKMATDGIVVLNGYAQFFKTDSDNCDRQSWDVFWYIPGRRLAMENLTIARRKRFNELVVKINKALSEAANEIAEDDDIGYKIGFAEWDRWVWESVDGQMCSTNSNGDYPDPKQPDMQFIKPDTHPWFNWYEEVHDELRKRELTEEEKRKVEQFEAEVEAKNKRLEDSLYDSILYKSPDPRAIIRRRLDARAPDPPGCPGDDSGDITHGLGMPDSVGRNFHPNENGHITIASFALAEAMDLRSIVLGIDAPSCALKDEFTCWSSKDSKSYAMADRLDAHYGEFCDWVEDEHDDHTVNWEKKKKYDEGTPEEHEFVVSLDNDIGSFDKEQCKDSLKKLIHNCDTNNPMNWKQGGKFVRSSGDYTYEVNPKKTNRPWPPPEEAVGRCEGWYKVLFGSYEIEGGGFSTWDHGQKTMRPNMDSCYGLGTTNWKFNYHDNPTEEGYEWKATFRTPIWVRARCFNNNKVVKAAGGWTNGCKGND